MSPKKLRYVPRDADWYLRSPELLKRSSNLALVTPGLSRDARTRGTDGNRYVDLYRETTPREIETWLRRTLSQDLDSFRAAIDPLKLVEINGSSIYDPRNDPVLQECCPGLGSPEFKKAREVCIATPRTDVLMRPFAEVLDRTAEISPSARAYRRGHRNAVHEVIIEIQRLVRGGGPWFFAVIDIKNFFPSMDRKWLRNALKAQGYTPGFIERVMVLVEAPIVDAKKRPVECDQGCPPGLRISGTLANIYCAALDAMIEATFGSRVRYYRYCDDIIIIAQKRHEVVGAASAVTRWLRERGHSVKGQGPGFSPEYLVHNLAKRSLDVLGARITAKGEITMIPKKTEALHQRILDAARVADALGPVIHGVSQYATWTGKREALGRAGNDWSDVLAAIDQIEEYWGPLNGPLTEEFSRELHERLGNEGLYPRPQQWAAVIPSGRPSPHVSDGGLLRSRSDLATRSSRNPLDNLSSGGRGPLAGDLCPGDLNLIPLYGGDDGVPGYGDRDEDMGDGRQPGCSCASPIHGDGRQDCDHQDHEALVCSRWPQPQDTCPVVEGTSSPNRRGSNAWFAQAQEGTDPARPPVAHSHVDAEVVVKETGKHNGRSWTTITVTDALGTSTRRYALPSQSALLEALIDVVGEAQPAGHDDLVVKTEAWLPKHLVRRGAKFHGVAVFDRVERLHGEVRLGETDLVLTSLDVPDPSVCAVRRMGDIRRVVDHFGAFSV